MGDRQGAVAKSGRLGGFGGGKASAAMGKATGTAQAGRPNATRPRAGVHNQPRRGWMLFDCAMLCLPSSWASRWIRRRYWSYMSDSELEFEEFGEQPVWFTGTARREIEVGPRTDYRPPSAGGKLICSFYKLLLDVSNVADWAAVMIFAAMLAAYGVAAAGSTALFWLSVVALLQGLLSILMTAAKRSKTGADRGAEVPCSYWLSNPPREGIAAQMNSRFPMLLVDDAQELFNHVGKGVVGAILLTVGQDEIKKLSLSDVEKSFGRKDLLSKLLYVGAVCLSLQLATAFMDVVMHFVKERNPGLKAWMSHFVRHSKMPGAMTHDSELCGLPAHWFIGLNDLKLALGWAIQRRHQFRLRRTRFGVFSYRSLSVQADLGAEMEVSDEVVDRYTAMTLRALQGASTYEAGRKEILENNGFELILYALRPDSDAEVRVQAARVIDSFFLNLARQAFAEGKVSAWATGAFPVLGGKAGSRPLLQWHAPGALGNQTAQLMKVGPNFLDDEMENLSAYYLRAGAIFLVDMVQSKQMTVEQKEIAAKALLALVIAAGTSVSSAYGTRAKHRELSTLPRWMRTTPTELFELPWEVIGGARSRRPSMGAANAAPQRRPSLPGPPQRSPFTAAGEKVPLIEPPASPKPAASGGGSGGEAPSAGGGPGGAKGGAVSNKPAPASAAQAGGSGSAAERGGAAAGGAGGRAPAKSGAGASPAGPRGGAALAASRSMPPPGGSQPDAPRQRSLPGSPTRGPAVAPGDPAAARRRSSSGGDIESGKPLQQPAPIVRRPSIAERLEEFVGSVLDIRQQPAAAAGPTRIDHHAVQSRRAYKETWPWLAVVSGVTEEVFAACGEPKEENQGHDYKREIMREGFRVSSIKALMNASELHSNSVECRELALNILNELCADEICRDIFLNKLKGMNMMIRMVDPLPDTIFKVIRVVDNYNYEREINALKLRSTPVKVRMATVFLCLNADDECKIISRHKLDTMERFAFIMIALSADFLPSIPSAGMSFRVIDALHDGTMLSRRLPRSLMNRFHDWQSNPLYDLLQQLHAVTAHMNFARILHNLVQNFSADFSSGFRLSDAEKQKRQLRYREELDMYDRMWVRLGLARRKIVRLILWLSCNFPHFFSKEANLDLIFRFSEHEATDTEAPHTSSGRGSAVSQPGMSLVQRYLNDSMNLWKEDLREGRYHRDDEWMRHEMSAELWTAWRKLYALQSHTPTTFEEYLNEPMLFGPAMFLASTEQTDRTRSSCVMDCLYVLIDSLVLTLLHMECADSLATIPQSKEVVATRVTATGEAAVDAKDGWSGGWQFMMDVADDGKLAAEILLNEDKDDFMRGAYCRKEIQRRTATALVRICQLHEHLRICVGNSYNLRSNVGALRSLNLSVSQSETEDLAQIINIKPSNVAGCSVYAEVNAILFY
ncbi:hypothetical protein CBR_g20106 [Chara braunii]|uniref:Uncharacterized protein n=1 Tax=Chara braunii TaxID=69332 RepID=A0A388KZJ1_CHABU|nr:hypothetical protein CBR_g20106 [Chara braunii]|eukprot:GBG75475.1 hypothetical protein CBR_g20106 [Chara braunii]